MNWRKNIDHEKDGFTKKNFNVNDVAPYKDDLDENKAFFRETLKAAILPKTDRIFGKIKIKDITNKRDLTLEEYKKLGPLIKHKHYGRTYFIPKELLEMLLYSLEEDKQRLFMMHLNKSLKRKEEEFDDSEYLHDVKEMARAYNEIFEFYAEITWRKLLGVIPVDNEAKPEWKGPKPMNEETYMDELNELLERSQQMAKERKQQQDAFERAAREVWEETTKTASG